MAEIDDANWRRLAAVEEGAGPEKAMRLAQWTSELQNLVPFLAATTASQDYLVHRLRELARGGAMSGYR